MSPLRNGIWMLLYQAARLVVGLVLTAAVARSLGPSRFGDYHAMIAIALFLSALASMGLQGVVIQEAAVAPAPATILGTALRLRLLSGTALLLGCLATWTFWAPQHSSILWLCALLPLLAQAADVVEYGFIAKQDTRPITLVHLAALLLASLGSAVALFFQAGTGWFLATFGLEYVLIVLGYVFWMRRSAAGTWGFDAESAVRLLRNGLPMLVSSLSYLLYMRIDTVMLKALAGSEQTGLYSASARLAQMGLFLPMIVVNAVSTPLARSWKESPTLYRGQVQALHALLATFGWCVSLGCTLLAPWLVPLLFGSHFEASIPLLALQGWIALPFFVRTGMDRAFVTEGLTRVNMAAHLSIALFNLGLNWLCIPHWGALGAVVASLASVLLGGFGVPWIFPTARAGMRQACAGLLGPLHWLRPAPRAILRSWLHR